MSYRDVEPMLECLFLVNDLPGGAGHHDGGMKDRDAADVLANPMFRSTPGQAEALEDLKSRPSRWVTTRARPSPGSPNLVLPDGTVKRVKLPGPGEMKSARDGSEAGYALVAETFPEQVFVVSCDLDASTKLAKARSHLAENHQFEISIEEQAATLIANGLATSTPNPQLNVVSTLRGLFRRYRPRRLRHVAVSAQSDGRERRSERNVPSLSRWRVHGPRPFLRLGTGLDQRGAQLPSVPAPISTLRPTRGPPFLP